MKFYEVEMTKIEKFKSLCRAFTVYGLYDANKTGQLHYQIPFFFLFQNFLFRYEHKNV